MQLLPFLCVLGGGSVLALIVLAYVHNSRVVKRVKDRALEITLRESGSSEKAVEQLVAEGIDQKDAIEIVKRVKQSMEDLAVSKTVVDLLASGTPEEEVKQKLISGGLDEESAGIAVQEIAHPPFARRHPVLCILIGLPLLVLGTGVLMASLVLRDGNLSGKFVTFPYAGLITKMVGVFIFMMGLAMVVVPLVRPRFSANPD